MWWPVWHFIAFIEVWKWHMHIRYLYNPLFNDEEIIPNEHHTERGGNWYLTYWASNMYQAFTHLFFVNVPIPQNHYMRYMLIISTFQMKKQRWKYGKWQNQDYHPRAGWLKCLKFFSLFHDHSFVFNWETYLTWVFWLATYMYQSSLIILENKNKSSDP